MEHSGDLSQLPLLNATTTAAKQSFDCGQCDKVLPRKYNVARHSKACSMTDAAVEDVKPELVNDGNMLKILKRIESKTNTLCLLLTKRQ